MPGQFHAQGAVNMSSCVSKIFAAASLSIGLTSICHGEERHSNRGPNTVYSFGNWRIDAVKENRSLQLFSTGDGAYFDIQCFAVGNDLAVHVPLSRKPRSLQFVAWGVKWSLGMNPGPRLQSRWPHGKMWSPGR